MKKKLLSLTLSLLLTAGVLTGCGQTSDSKDPAGNNSASQDSTSQDSTVSDSSDTSDTTDRSDTADSFADTTIHLGGLKGPTSMGLAELLDASKEDDSTLSIDYTMEAAADALTPAFIQGDLDMIAVPSNLASVLYNKTEGQVQVLAVNTLGVLYLVDTGDSIQSLADLKGKTIYATGQGATPEYSLNYLLEQNGLDPETDVTIEWKSEPAEIVSTMASSEEEVIAMLPQPFVTVAQTQVEGLNVAVDLNEEWNALQNGSSLVTGVLVARKDFVSAHPELVNAFLDAYQASTEYANTNVEETAAMVEELDIVKAAIAKTALPACNITYLEGDELKTALSGYLQILFDQDPQSVGGALPGDDFYYGR